MIVLFSSDKKVHKHYLHIHTATCCVGELCGWVLAGCINEQHQPELKGIGAFLAAGIQKENYSQRATVVQV